MTELGKVNLSHNNIGPEGATALADGFQYLSKLKWCNISHNNIDVAGATAIVQSLKECERMYDFVIKCNSDHKFVMYSGCIHIEDLMSSEDTTAISDLI